jgi:S1-C subfamily serine protease
MVGLRVVIALTPPLAVSQQDLETTVMLEKVRSAVVLIVTEARGNIIWEEVIPTLRELGLPPIVEVSAIGFGSGFIVTPNSYIVTNGHVVNYYESELEEVR